MSGLQQGCLIYRHVTFCFALVFRFHARSRRRQRVQDRRLNVHTQKISYALSAEEEFSVATFIFHIECPLLGFYYQMTLTFR